VIARTTLGTKYKILMCDISDDNVKIFKSINWAYGPCIAAFNYLRPVITIDAGFLSGHYKGRLLLMSCRYDVENKLLSLAFGIVDEENMDNWGWFMRWVRNEVIQSNIKICVISDRHRRIKRVFQRPHLGWSAECGEAVHRYCMQYIVENLYKETRKFRKKEDNLMDDFRRRLVNKKKPRRFIERRQMLRKSNKKAYDFLKNIKRRLKNDDKEFPNFASWAQTYNGRHRWGIMTIHGSEALNSLFRVERTLPVMVIMKRTWYKYVKWFDKREMETLNLQGCK
jgi:MULE transposase domain